jgi:hypothetical protein
MNQGGEHSMQSWEASKPSLKSALSFCLLDGTVVELRQGLSTVEQLQSERRIYDPFLIVSVSG